MSALHDLTPPPLDREQGVRLERPDYRRDFRERRAETDGRDSFKLERRQHFEELDHPGREALRHGDWDKAVRLIEAKRAELLAHGSEDARRGRAFRRTRIVEEPLSPYVQWELTSLRLQDECGTPVRVVHAEDLREAEVGGPLPELVVLGGRVLYEVVYTDAGVPDGAVRFTDPAVVEGWERYVKRLHDAGEGIQSYYARCVAGLPAPEPA